jgi:hypothetical protein
VANPSRFELVATEGYAGVRASLSPRRRRSIGFVESDIAEDPLHVHWRRSLDDGSVLDFGAADEGLLVRFRVASAKRVDLVDLFDIRAR